jgi:hypothetical protein
MTGYLLTPQILFSDSVHNLFRQIYDDTERFELFFQMDIRVYKQNIGNRRLRTIADVL